MNFMRWRSFSYSVLRAIGRRNFRTNTDKRAQNVKQDEGAIKFSTSEANRFKAREGYLRRRDAPFYEPLVISLSISSFLIYFCILREENDIDEKLGLGLFDHVPALEAQQLKVTLEYQKMHGMDTSAVETRLAEVQKRAAENLARANAQR